MSPFPRLMCPRFRPGIIALTGLVAIGMYSTALLPTPPLVDLGVPADLIPIRPPIPKALVVASIERDDTSWIHTYLPDWQVNRFFVDSESIYFAVPKNKGREAMVYLTYIINTYTDLPDIVLFMHSQRYQWHNDDPLYDGVSVIQKLQIPYVQSEGYVNLRCVWTLGCPSELNLDPEHVSLHEQVSHTTQLAYTQAFQELFPNSTLPSVVGVACCGQFALTRSKILSRPLEDYIRWRQWLLDTPLEDGISGRIFEYSWHIIFQKPAVHCPNAKECYCNVFGLCNLECKSEDKCGERWAFPPSAVLPHGWPGMGWDGQEQDEETLGRLKKTSLVPP